MCEDNRNLEEILTHGAIGTLGINYDALNHWARQHFNLRDDSWNAIFLIGYALTDNHNLQWHSTEDYETIAAAGPNRFHDETYLRIITAGSSDATAHWGVVGTDHTDLHCTVFRQGSASNFAPLAIQEKLQSQAPRRRRVGGVAWRRRPLLLPYCERLRVRTPARMVDESGVIPVPFALPGPSGVLRGSR